MTNLFGEEIPENNSKDWTGNKAAVFACNGDRNYAQSERQTEDFYATSPDAVKELLKREQFSKTILEPCVGQGHIARVFVGGGVQLYS